MKIIWVIFKHLYYTCVKEYCFDWLIW
jgi:hypothetical protein